MSNMLLELASRLQAARVQDEEGQALVEYGLIISLIAVVAVAALTALGTGVSSTLNSIVSNL